MSGLTTQKFLEKARKTHGDKYDYSKVEYKSSNEKVCIICPIHGEFWQNPTEHVRGRGCRRCGSDMKKKLILGVATYDKSGDSSSAISATWRSMIYRCYSKKHLYKYPTYSGCSVCDEWLIFSNFEKWVLSAESGYREGYHLDKDILVKGNKIYSPETCCFVPREINCMFTNSASLRGDLPLGVRKLKQGFFARFSNSGCELLLGPFNTAEEAFQKFKIAKERHIKAIADEWKENVSPRVYDAMMNYQVEITD